MARARRRRSARSCGMNVGVARLPLGGRSLLVVVAYLGVFFGVLPLLLWSIGGRVDLVLDFPRVPTTVPGGVFFLAGALFMGWSMLSLSRRGNGLPISHLPPSQLVARGP